MAKGRDKKSILFISRHALPKPFRVYLVFVCVHSLSLSA